MLATFWKVKKRVMGKTTNDMAAILDEEGIRQEDPDAIKEVYMKYFIKLLETSTGITEEEQNREELVNSIVANMEQLSKITEPQSLEKADLEDIVAKLDIKKAGDRDGWSNEIVSKGGEEMMKSLVKM